MPSILDAQNSTLMVLTSQWREIENKQDKQVEHLVYSVVRNAIEENKAGSGGRVSV